MTDEEAVPGQKTLQISGIKKRIIPYEHSDPASEPLFVNYIHAAFVGGSAYLDVGVIPIEEFEESTKREKAVDFLVRTRLVMTKGTMRLLREQIDQLLNRAAEPEGT
ncbi:MAG: hypothetical protein ACLQU1_43475 [Bryobacteraceae bacterium]